MKFISYNLNGIRSAQEKGFSRWLAATNPDVIGLQELKATRDQLELPLYEHLGYHCYSHHAKKKGYSGVALFTKSKAQQLVYGIGNESIDKEGRVITAFFDEYIVVNLYAPAASTEKRLEYKFAFFEALLPFLSQLQQHQLPLIIMGDFNICHHEIDLWFPDYSALYSGFSPRERTVLGKLIALGFADSFRELNPSPHQYTWWSAMHNARKRNLGCRIDYIFISNNLLPQLQDARHLNLAQHSDHCPVSCVIDT